MENNREGYTPNSDEMNQEMNGNPGMNGAQENTQETNIGQDKAQNKEQKAKGTKQVNKGNGKSLKASGKKPGAKKKRKRKKNKKAENLMTNILLVICAIVFIGAAFQLGRVLYGYYTAQKEYSDVRETATNQEYIEEGKTDEFVVDWDKLLAENPDVIGWIRFYPEPSEISYPILQGESNDTYIHTTISGETRTAGSIFMSSFNHYDFSDWNTIIYGHRMKDGSMFKHLVDYSDKDFWKENPYFYIYTPDGRKLTYEIYSVGQVEDESRSYDTVFDDTDDFKDFLTETVANSVYETNVDLNRDCRVVTLSTCTAASNNMRFVVRGVRTKEEFDEKNVASNWDPKDVTEAAEKAAEKAEAEAAKEAEEE